MGVITVLSVYCGDDFSFTDSSEQNRYSSDVQQEPSAHNATDETPLQDEDDETEEEEDEEQRKTMAALEFELLKYLTDN